MRGFLSDDAGAVTIDWVGLAAAVLLLGIMTIYAVFNQGVSSLVLDINESLANLSLNISVGTTPNLNEAALSDGLGNVVETAGGTTGSETGQSTPPGGEEGDHD